MTTIHYASISQIGQRFTNEDSHNVLASPDHNRWMGIVSDGMGGQSFGKDASAITTSVITDYWTKHQDEADSEEKVDKVRHQVSDAIDRHSHSLSHCTMGATMVMASIEGNVATIAHLGDSRCYVQRPGEGIIYQTKDHVTDDYGWETVSRCFFSYRSKDAMPDVVQISVKSGDRILLCSDGVHNAIPQDVLTARMMADKSPEEILDDFDCLCEKNLDDNYTAIMAIVG